MDAVIANTEVKRVVKNPAHRNAYRLNLRANAEYNVGKSPRHPNATARVKMYAELAGTKNRKNHGIKSLWDNTTESVLDGRLRQLQQPHARQIHGPDGLKEGLPR